MQQAAAALRFMGGGDPGLGQALDHRRSGTFDTGDYAGHPSILR
jgi:hypothetical protein